MSDKIKVGAPSTRAGGRLESGKRLRGEGGAALVEFAILLPLLVMLILGMFTGGLAYNQKQEMTHATREGARWAATVPLNSQFSNGTGPSVWANNVRDLVVARSNGDLTSAQVCVSMVTGSGSGGSTPFTVLATTNSGGGACIPAQTYPVTANDDGRRVQVTASKPATIELGLFGSYSVSLNTDATAKSESSV